MATAIRKSSPDDPIHTIMVERTATVAAEESLRSVAQELAACEIRHVLVTVAA